MTDLISRQAAIEHLKKRLYETALNNDTEHPYYEEMADNRVSVWLGEVPSVEPKKVVKDYCRPRNLMVVAAEDFHRLVEQMLQTIDVPDRKFGEWIKDDVGVHCSECFCGWDFFTGIPVEVYGFHFCPNCGANMKIERGEDGET